MTCQFWSRGYGTSLADYSINVPQDRVLQSANLRLQTNFLIRRLCKVHTQNVRDRINSSLEQSTVFRKYQIWSISVLHLFVLPSVAIARSNRWKLKSYLSAYRNTNEALFNCFWDLNTYSKIHQNDRISKRTVCTLCIVCTVCTAHVLFSMCTVQFEQCVQFVQWITAYKVYITAYKAHKVLCISLALRFCSADCRLSDKSPGKSCKRFCKSSFKRAM